jgi:hypothetical protein
MNLAPLDDQIRVAIGRHSRERLDDAAELYGQRVALRPAFKDLAHGQPFSCLLL